MSVLARLYKNQCTDRNNLENFLSEALCEMLNIFCRQPFSDDKSEFIANLFRSPGTREWQQPEMVWQTQFVIRSGSSHAVGRRPDLHGKGVVNGKSVEVIIENKIDAGFTGTCSSDLPEAHQLVAYQKWLDSCSVADEKMLILISLRPMEVPWSLAGRIIQLTWPIIHERLAVAHCKLDANSTARYFVGIFLSFLESLSMKQLKISLPLVSAFENYSHATVACQQLGALAQAEAAGFRRIAENASFFVPAYTSNAFNPPAFYGDLYTPGKRTDRKGLKPDESNILCWCGVLTSKAYVIAPRQQFIPELHSGIAAWIPNKSKIIGAKESAESILRTLSENGFVFEQCEDSDCTVFLSVIRKSFLELLMEPDPTSTAQIFFATAFNQLSKISADNLKELRRLSAS